MELFNENSCLTDEGLQALVNGQLDELGRLDEAWLLADCPTHLTRDAHATASGSGSRR